MDNRLDQKKCYFCSDPSEKKFTLNPQTKILNTVYLTAQFNYQRYPVCKLCAEHWDKSLNLINATHKEMLDNLFEIMVAEKGAPRTTLKEPTSNESSQSPK